MDKIKSLAADAPIAEFGPFLVRPSGVEKRSGKGRGKHPLEGVSATVETGEEMHRRITATRLVLTGVFAWAIKKKSGGTYFLTIEGPGFAWVEEVDRKKHADAVKVAAAVRGAVAAPVSE